MRESRNVETDEELGRNMVAKLVDVIECRVGVHTSAVDPLQRPRPNPDRYILTASVPKLTSHQLEADVGERAPDVGEHLDHLDSLHRGQTTALLSSGLH
jgi:hypothetical protein